ncbi:SGNH/GDSL hydrolase family protein [Gluconacetobacter sp. Hr-1-5]|uniref:SGNH/GDSL hydrolase family protein n=1 Tax=Gluconacetobacter sp. Hr-1-5 TaxID=3395370 RepID=UPI003B51D469
MIKTLFIGFSVTEMPSSYIPRLQWLASARQLDIEIDKCGIGGITTQALPYMINRILSNQADAERVVYEVSTSYVRSVYSTHLDFTRSYYMEIWSHIEQLILCARIHGKDVAFVNLPRADVDYSDDSLEKIITQVCALYGVPVLSVSMELVLAGVPIDRILNDEVHPNAIGVEIYAEKILNFIEKLGPAKQSKYTCLSSRIRFDSLRFADYSTTNQRRFDRHGFSEEAANIREGETIVLNLPENTQIDGFSVLCGPKSGTLVVETDAVREFVCYDKFCYYERMMTAVDSLGQTNRVSVHLLPVLPNIPLIKGESDLGPREMGLLYLFVKRSL